MIVLIGLILRALAARGDLWFDEIWSLYLTKKATSLLGIFTEIHHDNNNYLNTFFLYILGPQTWLFAYRIPAVLFGAGTIALAWVIGHRRSILEGNTAAFLTASSYLLIHYSSEARGYAPALFFSFLAFWAMDNFLETKRRGMALLFSASVILGFLSHLTFLYPYIALALWSSWHFLKHGREWKANLAAYAQCHVLPLVGMGLLYFVDIRFYEFGGADASSWGGVYLRTAVLAWGVAVENQAAVFLGFGAIAITLTALFVMWREQCEHWIPLSAAILLAPALAQLRGHAIKIVYERHFLTCVGFGLLLLAFGMSRLWHVPRWGRWMYSLIMVAFLVGNCWHTGILLRDGRGDYRGALNYMAEHSQESRVTIISDHDLRNGGIIAFYAPLIKRQFVYYNTAHWPQKGAEWYIMHSQKAGFVPLWTSADRFGNQYRLVLIAPYAGLSGWSWYIYHRAAHQLDNPEARR
jgi:hypothetical protein